LKIVNIDKFTANSSALPDRCRLYLIAIASGFPSHALAI
jgi:hypothetical protein